MGVRSTTVAAASAALCVCVVLCSVALVVEADSYCSGAGCGALAESLHGKTRFKVDDTALMYVWVTDGNTTLKAPFFPKVDEFSVLEIPFSGASLYRNTTARVHVSLGEHTTEPREYTDGFSFVGYYSVLVHMRAGTVLRLTWDEGCTDCPSGCIDSNCALPYSDYGVPCYDTACAVKVYAAWLGTDADDTECVSAGLLPSNFRKFALSNVRKDAASVSGNAVGRAEEDAPGTN